ncbi:MAG: hypothetical protein D6814_09745 [Calditrichaeota bacterium]|nr:MAG: hypothetical protein D6814_09745 [Calditrichota bacterium]
MNQHLDQTVQGLKMQLKCLCLNLFRDDFHRLQWLITLVFFWGFALGFSPAGYAQNSGKKGDVQRSFKLSKQSKTASKIADSQNEINLGRIYIYPFTKGKQGNAHPRDVAQEELNRLNRERQEIIKTLEKLQQKVRERRSRAKRNYRRPCV